MNTTGLILYLTFYDLDFYPVSLYTQSIFIVLLLNLYHMCISLIVLISSSVDASVEEMYAHSYFDF